MPIPASNVWLNRIADILHGIRRTSIIENILEKSSRFRRYVTEPFFTRGQERSYKNLYTGWGQGPGEENARKRWWLGLAGFGLAAYAGFWGGAVSEGYRGRLPLIGDSLRMLEQLGREPMFDRNIPSSAARAIVSPRYWDVDVQQDQNTANQMVTLNEYKKLREPAIIPARYWDVNVRQNQNTANQIHIANQMLTSKIGSPMSPGAAISDALSSQVISYGVPVGNYGMGATGDIVLAMSGK